jgi:hypothetical protein
VPGQRDDHVLHACNHVVRHLVDGLRIATAGRIRATLQDRPQTLAQRKDGHIEAEFVELHVGRVDRGLGRHDHLTRKLLRSATAHQRQGVQQAARRTTRWSSVSASVPSTSKHSARMRERSSAMADTDRLSG